MSTGDTPGPSHVCDLSDLTEADLATLDAVARLCLVVRRAGQRIELRGVSPALAELIDLVGLFEALDLDQP